MGLRRGGGKGKLWRDTFLKAIMRLFKISTLCSLVEIIQCVSCPIFHDIHISSFLMTANLCALAAPSPSE